MNIGGWLVLEPYGCLITSLTPADDLNRFITPSIFERHSSNDWPVVDEWTLCEKLGKDGCYEALTPHWETFVRLADFQKIKDSGFNVIRIPIGYWAYMDVGHPYTWGAAEYMDRAIDWARQTGLKVIIDLHGAPKSQNGFDHSGRKLASPGWGQGDSIAETHAVLKIIEEKYAKWDMQDVVIAIQVVNEPFVPILDSNMVKQFYRDAFYNLREISDTPIMLHDGFVDPSWMNNFLTPEDNAHNVIVDHHEYQIFGSGSGLASMSTAEHRSLVCNSFQNYASSDKWTIIGEWSGAMTDCAKYLNGFKAGNRYEGTFPGSWSVGSCQGKSGWVNDWSQEWKDDVRRYIETQLDTFEANTNGWVYWNFKTEGDAGEWDLFQLLDAGVFPQPLDDRRFGKYCTNF